MDIYNAHAPKYTLVIQCKPVNMLLPLEIYLYIFLEVFNFSNRVVPVQSKAEENQNLRGENTKWSLIFKLSSVKQLTCSFLISFSQATGFCFLSVCSGEQCLCPTGQKQEKSVRPVFCTESNPCIWKKVFFPNDFFPYSTSNLVEKLDY